MSSIKRRLGKRRIEHHLFEEEADDTSTETGEPGNEVGQLNLTRYKTIKVAPDKHVSTKIIGTEIKWALRGSIASVREIYSKVSANATVKNYIDNAGWSALFVLDIPKSDNCVMHALLERWWDSTHTFHFEDCELGITPLDFTTLTGIQVGSGEPPPFLDEPYSDFKVMKAKFFHDCETMLTLKDYGIPLIQFRWYWEQVGRVQEGDADGLGARIARAFMCWVTGKLFFPNAGGVFYYGWLVAFEDLSRVGHYDWGGTMLARIYVALNQCSRLKMKSVDCFWQVVEYWFYEYGCTNHPTIREYSGANPLWPRLAKWTREMRSSKRGAQRYNTAGARSQLDMRNVNSLAWTTFIDEKYMEHPEYKLAFDLSLRRVTFFDPVYGGMMYLGDRCWRQVTGTIVIPHNPPDVICAIAWLLVEVRRRSPWPDAQRYFIKADPEMYTTFWHHVIGGVVMPSLMRAVNVDVIHLSRVPNSGIRVPHGASVHGESFVYNTHPNTSTPQGPDWTIRIARSPNRVDIVPIPPLAETLTVPPANAYTTDQWRSMYEAQLGLTEALKRLILDNSLENMRRISALEAEKERVRSSHSGCDGETGMDLTYLEQLGGKN